MRVSVVCVIDDGEKCCVMIILNWREMRDGEEMLCLNWREMCYSVVCDRWLLCDDNSKLKRNEKCLVIILNWREMCVSVVCVIDGEECCVMIILNWREMRVSVVCVIDDGEEMLCDDNSKLKKKCAFQLFV